MVMSWCCGCCVFWAMCTGCPKGLSGPPSLRRLWVVIAATSNAAAPALVAESTGKKLETTAPASLDHDTRHGSRYRGCVEMHLSERAAMCSCSCGAVAPPTPTPLPAAALARHLRLISLCEQRTSPGAD